MKRELDYFLQILGVAAFAVAQPVLDAMGRSPETFLFRGVEGLGIVAFALIIVVVPATALWALSAVARAFGLGVRRGAHLAVLGGLFMAIALQVLKRFASWPDHVLIAIGAGAGGAAIWLLARTPAAQTFARWSAVAPAAFLVLFLFFSPVSKLTREAAAGAAAADARRVPVVMVVFDEFPLASLMDRSGEINADLYPNFADLAATSTWYRNYTVTEWLTRHSIPTMLTGRIARDPSKDAIAIDHPDNLFSLLAASHRMEVLEPFTDLCASACSDEAGEDEAEEDLGREGLSGALSDAYAVWRQITIPGAAESDPAAQFAETGGGGEVRPDALDEEGPRRGGGRDTLHETFVGSLRRTDRPSLYYLHSVSTHVPWNRLPDGRAYQTLPGPREDLALTLGRGPHGPWVDQDWPVRLGRQRHVFQVRYTDELLGAIMGRLREIDLFDEALVIVTSDHGGAFQPGEQRRLPTRENLHQIYWVPLLIKAPHQERGEIDDRNLSAPDLLPTIASLLGTEVPWDTDGRSAADRGWDRGPMKTFVRRPGAGVDVPERRFTVDQRAVQRRLRREAVRPGRCGGLLPCPAPPGPEASMVGKPVGTFQVGAQSDLEATLLLPRSPESGGDRRPPILVLGDLSAPAQPEGTRVVVAMNGTIGGVSETWLQGESAGRFGALLPPALIRRGENDLQLFELDGGVLRPIRILPSEA